MQCQMFLICMSSKHATVLKGLYEDRGSTHSEICTIWVYFNIGVTVQCTSIWVDLHCTLDSGWTFTD